MTYTSYETFNISYIDIGAHSVMGYVRNHSISGVVTKEDFLIRKNKTIEIGSSNEIAHYVVGYY